MDAVKIVLHPKSEDEKSNARKDSDLIVDLDQQELNALKEAKKGTTIQLTAIIDKGYNGSNNPLVQDTYQASMFELDEFTDPKIIKPGKLPKNLSHGTKITIEVTKQK